MEKNSIIRNFILKNSTLLEDNIEFSDSDNIFDMGIVNSLFAMTLLDFVEREFNITVENHEIDIENFSSVNNIAKLVESKELTLAT